MLAAGAGERLRPLSLCRPKALCPVGGTPLLDGAVRRVADALAAASDVTRSVPHSMIAVNAHAQCERVVAHLEAHWPDAKCSVEAPVALGTAGALGNLRGWLDGRAVLVVNADAWTTAPFGDPRDGWDGRSVRVWIPGGAAFGPAARIAGALLPWADVAPLRAEPSGLYETVWRRADAEGRLEVLALEGPFVDCGTPADYLAANMLASGGRSVIGDGARVDGVVERTVVWDGAEVARGETLRDAIRADGRVTVLVRSPGHGAAPRP